jgi:hypothetical protein
MPKLFNAQISKSTRKVQAKVLGFYTTVEAANVLGVVPSTLRYRRDSASAQSYWELLGLYENDECAKMLAKSHKIINRKHYYATQYFDAFAHKYLQKPRVARARKEKKSWEIAAVQQTAREIMQLEINGPTEVLQLAKVLMQLLQDGRPLKLIINEI